MMLKINKTLPKNKTRYGSQHNISRVKCANYLGLAALICGIMPGLMGLSYYSTNSGFGFSSNKAYAAKLSIDNISTMQEMRPGICHNMNIGDTATLTDTRDDSTYTIAKLSDGKCWMTQNLRLAGGTVLSRTDTDLDPSVYTTDEQTYTLPTATTEGFSETKLTDSTDTKTYMNHQVRDSVDNDYGAYYSWCAATAGTCQIGTYANIQPSTTSPYNTSNPTATTAVPAKENATSSICPKGWRLPTGKSSGEYQVLYKNYPNATPSAFQTNNSKSGYWLGGDSTANGGAFFPAAGGVNTSGTYNVGSKGIYWSSTASSVINGYRLFFDSTSIFPFDNANKCLGVSVRCVTDSYAEEDVNVVAVKVAPTISIDASTGARVEVDPNEISKDGTITATISANTTYDVLLSADEPNLVSTTDTTKYIPASSNIAIRTNGWGIKNEDNTYSAITTTPTTYYNTSSYDETKQQTLHTFNLGISIAPSLPSGTYSTTVTVTAVNN